MNQIAVAALEGRAVEPDEAGERRVAVPLPLHAESVLDELPTAGGPEFVVRRLKPLLGMTASVTRLRRLGLLAACVVPPMLMSAMALFGLFMGQPWFEEHPDVAPLHYCLLGMEKLDAASGPADDAPQQQRRALEVYAAGRFGETISNLAGSSQWFAKNLFTENQWKIAEQAMASHPDPSANEVSEATARLQPFLDAMPERLPGFPDGAPQMLVELVAFAMGYLSAWVAVPSAICAILFRSGLLMYVFGIAVVTKDGSRASRLRTFWRSLVTWSPCVPLPILMILPGMIGLPITWPTYLLPAVMVAIIAWSVSMPVRGIPDRIVGTYPVPR